MADYHFISRWRVEATCEEVSAILGDAAGLARWWPSVYLEVRVLEPSGPDGTGSVVALHTKGFLPYTIKWQFRVTESRAPHGFSLRAFGDFDGTGVWTFTRDDRFVDIVYDWRISAEKPLLRYGSFLLRPLFSLNHEWAMARGLESLELEIARRRARTDAERAVVPPPPGPTFPHSRRR